eukprot:scaffold12066_cov171-Amphora_coffeaeformis.AAC.5
MTFHYLFVMLLLSVAASLVAAVPTYYSDRAAFEAACQGALRAESFEGDWDATSQSVTFDELIVSESNGQNFVAQSRDFLLLAGFTITDGTGAVVFDDNGASIGKVVSFTSPMNAFGFDISANEATVVSIASTNGVVSDVVTLVAATPKFWGVIDKDATFTTLDINASGAPIIGFDSALYALLVNGGCGG